MVTLGPHFALANDNPYLAFTGELWGVFREFSPKTNDHHVSRAHCFPQEEEHN